MLKKHPRALAFIFFTEMWERVGFYALMSILVLYMIERLGFSESQKGNVFGFFLGLCYFVPLLGGWLGDKVFGRIGTVRAGACLMALGYVGLALSGPGRVAPFYLGLLLIAFGTGIFKVNMAVLVGNLYTDKPHLKDAGYNIFYMGVNLGALVAPLVATLNNAVFHSYNLSFWVAAAGMVFALIIWQAGEPYLRAVDRKPGAGSPAGSTPDAAAEATAARPAMDRREERQRIATLIVLFLVVIFFWVAFYQIFDGLVLFAKRSTRVVLKLLRPETYNSFEPLFILVLTPLMLSLFARLKLKAKEPSTPAKILFGMLIMNLAMFVMVAASLAGGNHDRNIMSPAWLIGTYFVITIAEILISPMGQSFVSKVAPPKIAGLMMGGWFAATAAGTIGSGQLGKYYSQWAHHWYFLFLAGLMLLAAALVALFLKKLKRFAT
jgi:proton-dependent oligopeptide transporter, POT family